MAKQRLGTMLIEAGLLTEQALRVALHEQQRFGGSLGRTLVEMKLVGEGELVRVLAQQLKVNAVDLDAIQIPQSVLALVPADLADLHGLIPYAQPMKFLDVAMTDPTNVTVIDELRMRTRLNIRPALAGPKMLERAIGKYYGRGFSRFYGDVPLALDSLGPALEVEKSDNEPALDDLLVEDAAPRLPAPPTTPARPTPPPVPKSGASAEVAALERRIAQLETLVARQDAIIGKLVTAIIDHGMGTRDDLLR
jgi:hypothetical protein